MKLTRRQFLAALSATSVAPTILIPRATRAQQQATQAGARARQVLIIYAQGGLRSHALFSFDGAPKSLNPYGVAGTPANPKVPFRLASPVGGNKDLYPFPTALDDFMPDWGENLPPLYTQTERFSLLGPVDHNPGGEAVVDEKRARNLIATGRAEGGPGLLTIIGNGLGATRALPPFCIGDPAAIFGNVTPGLEAFAPVFVRDPLDIGATSNAYNRVARDGRNGAVDQWELALRASLDDDLKAKNPRAAASVIDRVIGGRSQMKAVQEALSLSDFRFGNADTTATGPYSKVKSQGTTLTNRALEQAFLPFLRFPSGGSTTTSNFTDPLGAKLAMAVRLFQAGCPAVAVGYGGFDLHRDEDRLMHLVTRPLARGMSALLMVLSGLPGVQAKTMLDETLMVVVSEFGRDNVRDDTGFNDQGGSDHRGEPSSRYQILPVFGAGVKGGRLIGGFSPNDNLTPTGKTFSSASLSATLVNALGVDPRQYISADPIEDIFSG